MSKTVLYIVRVCEDGEAMEYEYGNLQHAMEHLQQETAPAELLLYEYNSAENRRTYTTIAKNR